jgi:hypothetical protein
MGTSGTPSTTGTTGTAGEKKKAPPAKKKGTN